MLYGPKKKMMLITGKVRVVGAPQASESGRRRALVSEPKVQRDVELALSRRARAHLVVPVRGNVERLALAQRAPYRVRARQTRMAAEVGRGQVGR